MHRACDKHNPGSSACTGGVRAAFAAAGIYRSLLTVVDGGLNSALVQSKEVKERDYSTVFIITLGLTAVMIVLLYFAAPLIAYYYQSPALIMPLRIYSLSMFFSAFNSIQVARMQREMRFREMMYCSLAATLTAGTLGIAMAYKGAGLWALVGYYFSHIAVTCIAMFCTDRWIPRGKFSKDSAKRLYGFGIKMLASSMITTIYNDIRPLIIGKSFRPPTSAITSAGSALRRRCRATSIRRCSRSCSRSWHRHRTIKSRCAQCSGARRQWASS